MGLSAVALSVVTRTSNPGVVSSKPSSALFPTLDKVYATSVVRLKLWDSGMFGKTGMSELAAVI